MNDADRLDYTDVPCAIVTSDDNRIINYLKSKPDVYVEFYDYDGVYDFDPHFAITRPDAQTSGPLSYSS